MSGQWRQTWWAMWQANLAGDHTPWGCRFTCHSDGWERSILPQEHWLKSPWQQISDGDLAHWVPEGHSSKKNVKYWREKEQLGKRSRGTLQHLQSYRSLSSLAPCDGAFRTILWEAIAIENESSLFLCISLCYYFFYCSNGEYREQKYISCPTDLAV